MKIDDLDQVEDTAIEQGVAQHEAEKAADEGQANGAESQAAAGEGGDEQTQAPADVEQGPDSEPQGFEGGVPSDGAGEDPVPAAEQPRPRRIFLPDLEEGSLLPSGIEVIGRGRNGDRMFMEISGSGPDLEMVVERVFDEHFGDTVRIYWK